MALTIKHRVQFRLPEQLNQLVLTPISQTISSSRHLSSSLHNSSSCIIWLRGLPRTCTFFANHKIMLPLFICPYPIKWRRRVIIPHLRIHSNNGFFISRMTVSMTLTLLGIVIVGTIRQALVIYIYLHLDKHNSDCRLSYELKVLSLWKTCV